MSRLERLSSVILVISVPIMLIALSQNILFRFPGGYQFYFNDSQVTDKLNTPVTNSEIANGISSFFNHLSQSEFQIYEDTGYDKLGIFSPGDSYNMIVMRRTLTVSAGACIIAAVVTAAIYIYLRRNDHKKILRISFRISMIPTAALFILQTAVLSMPDIREGFFRIIGLREMTANSELMVILDDGFWSQMSIFLAVITIIIIAVAIYVHYRLTRPPRMFSRT